MKYIVVLWVFIYALSAQINDSVSYPKRPGDREFIFDGADLLSTEQEQRMRQKLDKLLTETAIPIIVVTIKSLQKYNAPYYGEYGMRDYAKKLFNHWGIGYKKVRVQGKNGGSKEVSWNKGILLLISVQDRQARIELGADYGYTKDEQCRKIMDQHIIFYFRQRQFSKGIEAGVNALEKVARNEKIPNPPVPASHYILIALFVVLGIFTFVSLSRQGASGWAWVFWGAVFSILGAILIGIITSSGRSGGRSSGFSGGSFGGGFSGGGGASGSW
ncbi:TPM domain-containing protein [Candidatus Uabimicrobium amorphum]|uniref:TPM domain-containing protein n=1 Tax=Uabimicrobium amorphum TaxID=2596890 RepID=A0A5S9IN69_UABAM|nr:TPM domain-containing protein [Candidatus Uabimicrobium amorphum]BBM84617.1 hypothetical protein UABAM_02978 [Candidatus Uabimicrobium amorphum]